MAIFRLKIVTWTEEEIPCRKKTDCVCAIFFNIFEFDFLDFFIWTQIEFLKCMIWQSNFLLFFLFFSLLFFFMTCLFRAETHAIDGFLDWSPTPHVRIVLKMGRLLVQGLFTSFLSKKRVWLKNVPFMSVRKKVMV